jgi:1-acyl-sn-glycerol-3-phosphate acyltransferase
MSGTLARSGSQVPSTNPGTRGPRWGRRLAWFMAHVLWSTEVVGAENVPADGPVLLAANHTGVIDGPLLMGAAPRPAHVLVKAEAFRGPAGAVLRGAGQIPVDRDSGRGALQAALAVLRRGGVVGVFPEGNRGRGDAAAARAGVAWLALRAQAPVVPVAVLGTRRTGESVGHVPGLRRRCVVEFGQPIILERTDGSTGKAATEAANDAIRVALAELVTSASARTGLSLPADGPGAGSTTASA